MVDVDDVVDLLILLASRKLVQQLLAPARTCSGQKAETVLGFRPVRSIGDSIRRSAAWYVEGGWI